MLCAVSADGNEYPHRRPCRVRLGDGTVIDAVITGRSWSEDRGWEAEIVRVGASKDGLAELVSLDQVERLPGVDYSGIKPRWYTRTATGGWVSKDHPPSSGRG